MAAFSENPYLINITFLGKKEPEYCLPFSYTPVHSVNVRYNYIGSSFGGKRIVRMPDYRTAYFSPNYKSRAAGKEIALLILYATLE